MYVYNIERFVEKKGSATKKDCLRETRKQSFFQLLYNRAEVIEGIVAFCAAVTA